EDKKQIYEDAIILLYRLLFLGYAEARELLPVRADDPDYQDSFTMLCQTAKDYYIESRLTEVGNDFDLWDRLDSQLRIYVDKNYNGGLFSNDDKPILKEYRIANKHLAPCLMELAYIAGRKKDYAQKIEYKDLSVRNLGAIYEGLLEYQLFIADELMVQRKSKEKVAYIKASETTLKNSDKNNLVQPGEIYLSQDAMERKETGAYYTPEDVVDYIVKNTVGKRLDELKAELDDELKEVRDELSYEPVEHRRKQLQHEIDEKTVEFITEKILSLSIVDSAMGSGHFLVNAAYQVSNYIVDILEGNQWENDEINADVTYWRRKVVENCIYGIDINNLSVLLARLSLWLISVTNDKALSFIDHHLKCGNSIVGTTTDKVQYINKDIPLFNMTKEQYMFPVIRKYERIKEIGSDTKADVALQHEVYEEIRTDLAVIKRKMDYYLASMYAGGISDEEEFRKVMYADSMEFFDDRQFKNLLKYADNNKFFHWELEFPEVFIGGGFDIAIGNPPYIECALEEYEKLHLQTHSSRNLYAYMIENTIEKLKNGGNYGYIIPIASFYSNRTESFRKYILAGKRNYVSNYGVRPAQIFRKAEQRVSIFYGTKTEGTTEIYTTSYQIWYKSERKHLFSDMKFIPVHDLKETQNVPKLGNTIELDIYDRVYSTKHTMGELLLQSKGNNNFVFHTAGGYWLKAFDFMPTFKNEKTGKEKSTKYQIVTVKEEYDPKVIIAIINSSLFYWCWVQNTAVRDFYRPEIERFPIEYEQISEKDKEELVELCNQLMSSYKEHSVFQERNGINGKTILQEFHPSANKPIVDRIDDVLGRVYGFNDEELEFIKNFQYRFRMAED
ncbi:MAG: Eco57I restriction-modification methylase domain-containing protein, partial [Eubacterium sp.]|nr:Eco57I restriction-modification methylase domain-containing protein [Eubacterium sp.]